MAGCLAIFRAEDIANFCDEADRKDLLEKYQYFKLCERVDKDVRLCWCPLADCKKGYAWKSGVKRNKPLTCLECGY